MCFDFLYVKYPLISGNIRLLFNALNTFRAFLFSALNRFCANLFCVLNKLHYHWSFDQHFLLLPTLSASYYFSLTILRYT